MTGCLRALLRRDQLRSDEGKHRTTLSRRRSDRAQRKAAVIAGARARRPRPGVGATECWRNAAVTAGPRGEISYPDAKAITTVVTEVEGKKVTPTVEVGTPRDFTACA